MIHEHDQKATWYQNKGMVEKRKRLTRSLKYLRGKGMNESTKETHNLSNLSRQALPCQFASNSMEEFLDEKEREVMNAIRQVLMENDLLPLWHDDYHVMLRQYIIGYNTGWWKEEHLMHLILMEMVF